MPVISLIQILGLGWGFGGWHFSRIGDQKVGRHWGGGIFQELEIRKVNLGKTSFDVAMGRGAQAFFSPLDDS